MPNVVAILADIHGNPAGLRAVLTALESETWDELVVAGDIVFRGPRDSESVDIVRGLTATVLVGNTDRFVTTHDGRSATEIRAAIGPARTQYLAGLPRQHRVTPPRGRRPSDDLLIVHATPTSLSSHLIVEEHPIYRNPRTPPADARRLIGDSEANLIVGAHVHYTQSGRVGTQRFMTVAPVSFAIGGDPRAAYGLATWDGQGWKLEHRYVEYDVESVADEIERSGTCSADQNAHWLRTGTSPRARPSH